MVLNQNQSNLIFFFFFFFFLDTNLKFLVWISEGYEPEIMMNTYLGDIVVRRGFISASLSFLTDMVQWMTWTLALTMLLIEHWPKVGLEVDIVLFECWLCVDYYYDIVWLLLLLLLTYMRLFGLLLLYWLWSVS